MKKFLTLAVVFISMLAIASCSSYPKTPTEVANKVLEAVDKNDIDALKKYFVIKNMGTFYDCDDSEIKDALDEFFTISMVHRSIEYQRHYSSRPITPISDFELIYEEISEDGQEAVVLFLPKDKATEETKKNLSEWPWIAKWRERMLFDHIRLNITKNSDGKWKAIMFM